MRSPESPVQVTRQTGQRPCGHHVIGPLGSGLLCLSVPPRHVAHPSLLFTGLSQKKRERACSTISNHSRFGGPGLTLRKNNSKLGRCGAFASESVAHQVAS